MFETDLNYMGLASYNELIRLKVVPDIPKDELTEEDLTKDNEIIYNKLGDYLLNQILEYKDGHVQKIDYKFDETGGFVQLILILALCYINNMNLNNYFNLPIKLK